MTNTPSPRWEHILSRLETTRSPLRPIALAALMYAWDQKKLKDCRFRWSDYHAAFQRVAPPQHKSKAWMPFFYLSGRTRVWTLWLGETPSDFSDLAKHKPGSASALTKRTDHARVEPELFDALKKPHQVKALKAALAAYTV